MIGKFSLCEKVENIFLFSRIKFRGSRVGLQILPLNAEFVKIYSFFIK
ncbi:MAG: hypothetical protein H6Q42_666 [Deltaproteobacteria bacterium]|nr:hypothetical protein [Deltaproteobacteria bacterium]